VLAAVAAALILAACGSSTTKTTAAKTKTGTTATSTNGSGAVIGGTTTVAGTVTNGTTPTTTTTTTGNGKSKSHGLEATTVASVLNGTAKGTPTSTTTPATTTTKTKTKTTTTPHTNTSTTQTKTVTVTVTKTTTAPAPPAGTLYLTVFRSPSGNIGCQMQTWAARCDVDLRDWAPPAKPSSCKYTWGQGLRIAAQFHDNTTWVCSGISLVDKSAAALPYGDKNYAGTITCSSAQAGITCKNAGGHGFFISKSRYRIF
jgi:hypothetical protein